MINSTYRQGLLLGVSSVALSSDGNRVLSASPSGVYLWGVDNGELIKGPLGGDASVPCSSGIKIVVENRYGAIDEWYELGVYTTERADGLLIVDIGHVTSVSGGNRMICYATGFEDGNIRLWDRIKKTAIGEPLRGHSGKVLALAFGPFMNEYLP